jgi:hypothetical protein
VGVVSLNCEPLDWAARESSSCETWQGPAIDLTRQHNWLGNDRDRPPGSLSFTSKTGKRSGRNTASAPKSIGTEEAELWRKTNKERKNAI